MVVHHRPAPRYLPYRFVSGVAETPWTTTDAQMMRLLTVQIISLPLRWKTSMA